VSSKLPDDQDFVAIHRDGRRPGEPVAGQSAGEPAAGVGGVRSLWGSPTTSTPRAERASIWAETASTAETFAASATAFAAASARAFTLAATLELRAERGRAVTAEGAPNMM
jgi:hypothetical protein